MIEVREEVRPRWPLRLPRSGSPDSVTRVRSGVVQRILRVDGDPVWLRVAQPQRDRVVIGAQGQRRDSAQIALTRVCAALGVDDDLRPFYERFRNDPLIGSALRRDPWRRVRRRPDPFEALAWAIVEQLIEFERAAAIQRAIVRRFGRRCERTGLVEPPGAERLAAVAPAQLEACGLAAGRSLTLVRAAREVADGRVDLEHADHERGWRRLRAIRGIGPWTIEMLALSGQGRDDQLPAGDLNYLKLVGRLKTGGNPHARAEEAEVRELFARYDPYAGLAAVHLGRALQQRS